MASLRKLHEFGVGNFKSYESATLSLSPLTLLIGANASGKSNLLEALRLLAWLAGGHRLDQFSRAMHDDDVLFRGRLANFPRNGQHQFSLRASFSWGGVDNAMYRFEAMIEAAEFEPRLVNESVNAVEESIRLYDLQPRDTDYGHDVPIAYEGFTRGRKPVITGIDQQLVFTQLGTPARFGAKHLRSQKLIPAVCSSLSLLLMQVLFLDPEPRRMRDYTHKQDRQIKEDGSNLSSVLYDLCVRQKQKDDVLGFIRELPEQDIRDITFVETTRGEVMVQLVESFAGKSLPTDAPLLSDGTLRVLSICAAVLSAEKGSLVVVEEADNGVHPSRANLLLSNLQRVAKERELQVLLTSHNPALLDALPEEAIPAVACCYRDPKTGASKLIHLRDLPSYPELIAQGTVGRLMTKGILDRYLKEVQDPKLKRAASLKWLEQWTGAAT